MAWGPIGVAAPLALLALVLLPVVWWIVRALPPRPAAQVFPPAALLARLKPTEETPRAAPPWLVALRILAAALVILGLSGPSWSPRGAADERPLLIVLDDGWPSAPGWAATIEEAARLARGARGPVRLLTTAPATPGGSGVGGAVDALDGQAAAARLLAAAPQPWTPDPGRAAEKVAGLSRGWRVVWFSDGLAHPGVDRLAATLARLGGVEQRRPDVAAIAMTGATPSADGFAVGLALAPGAQRAPTLAAVDARGRAVARVRVQPDAAGGARLPVEAARTREVAMVRVEGAASAGGTRLLDAFDRRVRVGLVAPREDDQPLLSDAHYLASALDPHADVSRGTIETLTAAGLDAIVLPDTGALPEREAASLAAFVRQGGLLVRFAGPRLIAADPASAPDLLPLALSPDARNLKGGLALDRAGALAPFDREGPFAGLVPPDDALVAQVAAPAPGAAAAETWARLADGAPLVSAGPQGRGLIVLFHTTAGPAWSDVAFSGLQVAMLRRVLARAATSALPVAARAPTVALKPTLVLDGFGRARPPGPEDRAILPDEVAGLQPRPGHPPGIYEGGGARLVLHAAGPDTRLVAQAALPGVRRLSAPVAAPTALGPALLLLGLALLLLDATLALLLAGRLGRAPTRAASATLGFAALAFAFATGAPNPAATQTRPAGAGDVQLAYVRTGEAATDARARAGLEGLSRVLAARTAVEPGEVVGLDPAKDDLARFPLLYWLLPDAPVETSPQAARALDAYMRSGGVLFVDTRGLGRAPGQARLVARAALRGLETPPLERTPDDHVLTKAFYILRGFPGRHADASLWVESRASAAASANDGVSALIIGDGDWASAWAMSETGGAVAAVEGGQAGREIAWRVGVNVVLYALTGNYKADQVHVPTLLERIGPRARGGGR
jgi:hypothetical protein